MKINNDFLKGGKIMKKVKWLATVLVVASIVLGVIGCSNPSGPSGSGNGGAQGIVAPEGFVFVKGGTVVGSLHSHCTLFR